MRTIGAFLAVFVTAIMTSTTGASASAPRPAAGSTVWTGLSPVVGCVAGSVHGMRTDRLSYAATAVRRLNARTTLDGRHGTWFARRNVNGVTTVFGVLAVRVDGRCRATHYKVQLPIRPNGATGWVSAEDVRVRKVNIRIAIDLSQRRITLFRDGRVMLVTTAAIGAPSTPTPTGRFYVNQRLLAADPIGEYGPGAIGISAFSPVLRNWPQGGPIAIHGTDAPAMIGSASSHGCLRVHNSDASRLLRLVVEGTPVEIEA